MRLRHDDSGVVIATGAPRCSVGSSPREAYQTPRSRKLSPEQEAAIRREASDRTLRDLAAEFGVSHETVRAICRR